VCDTSLFIFDSAATRERFPTIMLAFAIGNLLSISRFTLEKSFADATPERPARLFNTRSTALPGYTQISLDLAGLGSATSFSPARES
jgi:hypothetical protein